MAFRSEKISFKNNEGHTLDARLELPDGRDVSTYAIFVHCFTCSKNVHAATRISRALTDDGIAVLRFDFTGLGNSDGALQEGPSPRQRRAYLRRDRQRIFPAVERR